jgi:shikimate dehydrogenase
MNKAGPPLAGVLGWPIGHSRSPRVHGHWLRRYGIDGHYIPIAVPADRLAESLRALALLGFRGVNVTIPHKEVALALADTVSTQAARIGAANTLTFSGDGRVEADNTDGYGFLANLQQGAPGWRAAEGPALVLGAGGAARAVIAALLDEGVPELRLANRSRDRAEALAAEFDGPIVVRDWSASAEAVAGAATIVNTTPLGMAGQPPLDLSLAAAPDAALVTDIVYQPVETPLLAAARARGLATVDGLGMLLHQAVPGFERWFGRRPEVDADLRAAALGQ